MVTFSIFYQDMTLKLNVRKMLLQFNLVSFNRLQNKVWLDRSQRRENRTKVTELHRLRRSLPEALLFVGESSFVCRPVDDRSSYTSVKHKVLTKNEEREKV